MITPWLHPASFDRLDQLRRDEARVAALWSGAVVVSVGPRGELPVTERPDGPALELTAATDGFDPAHDWLLGRDGDQAVFMRIDDAATGPTIRDVGDRLSPVDLELASMAVATAGWHRLEPRCPQCGGQSQVIASGAARWCPACDRDLFPRTDPAVIVAITDDSDRLLLGHQGVWAAGRYSILAGFVEAGESLEQAVHREVYEEVGVRLRDVVYAGSQPWPFPRSIMLGFRARAIATEVTVDGEEIVDARWFTRDELRSAVSAGEVALPMAASISRRLIDSWLDGTAS